MSATLVGDSQFTFGITGATQSIMGVVESVSITESYTTTVDTKDVEGTYTSPAEVIVRGKQAEVTISGIANGTAASLIKNGDALTFSGGTIESDISEFYVTSCEISGSAGDFVKVSITGIGSEGFA